MGELRKLDNDTRILPANSRTLRRYVTLAGQGRLQERDHGTPISQGRCMKLLTILKRYAMDIEVPFEQVDADAIEEYILGIEDDSIPKLKAVDGSSRYMPRAGSVSGEGQVTRVVMTSRTEIRILLQIRWI